MWKGKIEIPNLSEENEADELDVSFLNIMMINKEVKIELGK